MYSDMLDCWGTAVKPADAIARLYIFDEVDMAGTASRFRKVRSSPELALDRKQV